MVNEVNPQNFGRLEAEVATLQRDVTELREDVKTLLELANKSQGGFWMGMSIASLFGGVMTFVVERLFLR